MGTCFGLGASELDLEQLLDSYTDDRDQDMISLVAQDLMLDGIASDCWSTQPALWVPALPFDASAASTSSHTGTTVNLTLPALATSAFSDMASPRRGSAATIDVAAMSPCAPLMGSGWAGPLGSPHQRHGAMLSSFWTELGSVGMELRA
jgi:hypothetical protein